MANVWYDDPKILYVHSIDFVPLPEQSMNEQLNAIVRFSILVGLLLSISRSNLYFLFGPVLIAMGSTFVYKFIVGDEPELEQKESFSDCTHPTIENPFMNALIGDNEDRPEACDVTDPKINEEILENFSVNNIRDVTDIYNLSGDNFSNISFSLRKLSFLNS